MPVKRKSNRNVSKLSRNVKINSKRSKRASQKKRGRSGRGRKSRGGGNTKCGQLLFAYGLKGSLNNVPPGLGEHLLTNLFNEFKKQPKKKIKDDSFIDDFVKELINKITEEYTGEPSSELAAGRYPKIKLTLEKTNIIKPNINLVDYLKEKLIQAGDLNLTFTDFINTLTNGSLGYFLCKQIGLPLYKGEE
jgi:hypothetical protein